MKEFRVQASELRLVYNVNILIIMTQRIENLLSIIYHIHKIETSIDSIELASMQIKRLFILYKSCLISAENY